MPKFVLHKNFWEKTLLSVISGSHDLENLLAPAISERIIPRQERDKMIKYFAIDPDSPTATDPFLKFTKFWLKNNFLFLPSILKRRFDPQIDWTLYGLGIYAFVGKEVSTSNFNILFEPVAYKIPSPGQSINHSLDIQVLPNKYIAIDQNKNIYNTKSIARLLVAIHDTVNTQRVDEVFLDYEILIKFIEHAGKSTDDYIIAFQFARNALKGRLTFIVSCGDDVDNPLPTYIDSKTTLVDSMYLDDHDLIP